MCCYHSISAFPPDSPRHHQHHAGVGTGFPKGLTRKHGTGQREAVWGRRPCTQHGLLLNTGTSRDNLAPFKRITFAWNICCTLVGGSSFACMLLRKVNIPNMEFSLSVQRYMCVCILNTSFRYVETLSEITL